MAHILAELLLRELALPLVILQQNEKYFSSLSIILTVLAPLDILSYLVIWALLPILVLLSILALWPF